MTGAPISMNETEALGSPTIETMFLVFRAIHERGTRYTTEESADEVHERYMDLQDRIIAAVPVTARDVAMQVMADTHWGASDFSDHLMPRLRELAEASSLPTLTHSPIDERQREYLRHQAQTGHMVPVAQGGEFVALVNSRHIEAFPLPQPLSAADFVVGLEALGFGFSIYDIQPGEALLLRHEPEWPLPASWEARAHAIMHAFGKGRGHEGIDFLLDREEAQA